MQLLREVVEGRRGARVEEAQEVLKVRGEEERAPRARDLGLGLGLGLAKLGLGLGLANPNPSPNPSPNPNPGPNPNPNPSPNQACSSSPPATLTAGRVGRVCCQP